MIQTVIVFVIFIAALAYLGRSLYRHFRADNKTCTSGCGKCGVDFDKINQQLANKKL